MTMYLSPLVDVNEIDLSTTIPAVATSIGVLIIRDSWKGPELKVQLVNNIDELIELFGRPEEVSSIAPVHGQSYEDLLAGAGFLQFGNNLYCTRVLPPSATFAGAYGTIDALSASSSSSSDSSSSDSSSSSSSSAGCVQGWVDVTGPTYWDTVNAPFDGSWNAGSSRYESFAGENHQILLTNQNDPAVDFPSQIRINAEILSGWAPGDLEFDIEIVDSGGIPTIIYTGNATAPGLDTPFDIDITGISYGSFDIDTISLKYGSAAFYIHSVEVYEDCGSSSSQSSSSSSSQSFAA